MENYSVTKLDVSINADNLIGKSSEEIKKFIDESVCPVILSHLTVKPKNGEVHGDVRCSAGSGGVRCEGSIGGSIKI